MSRAVKRASKKKVVKKSSSRRAIKAASAGAAREINDLNRLFTKEEVRKLVRETMR